MDNLSKISLVLMLCVLGLSIAILVKVDKKEGYNNVKIADCDASINEVMKCEEAGNQDSQDACESAGCYWCGDQGSERTAEGDYCVPKSCASACGQYN